MQHPVTAPSEGRWFRRLFRLVSLSFVVCAIALAAVAPPVVGQPAPTPAPALAANGCPPEWSDQSYLCPAPSETSFPLIEYLYSDRGTDAIAIRLTPEGVEQALTCEGAAEIASMTIRIYEQLPREERARDSIEWAEPQMVDEIRAHARLGKIPEFVSASNPVDIVFPHYEGASRDASAGVWDLGQQVVFGTLWGCGQTGTPASDTDAG